MAIASLAKFLGRLADFCQPHYLGAGSLVHGFQPQARNGLGLKSQLDS
jgi:hypothetical protein